MPTQVPSNQIIQGLQTTEKLFDTAVQYGAISILVIIGIIGIILAATLFFRTYGHRNDPPPPPAPDPTRGFTEAFVAVAKVTDRTQDIVAKQQDQIIASEKSREISDEANRKLFEQINNKTIESLMAVSDATNRLADISQTQTALMTTINANNMAQTNTSSAIQTTLQSMYDVGSKPLQELIDFVKKENVENKKENVENREFRERILIELNALKELFTEAKKKTNPDLQKVVLTPEGNN